MSTVEFGVSGQRCGCTCDISCSNSQTSASRFIKFAITRLKGPTSLVLDTSQAPSTDSECYGLLCTCLLGPRGLSHRQLLFFYVICLFLSPYLNSWKEQQQVGSCSCDRGRHLFTFYYSGYSGSRFQTDALSFIQFLVFILLLHDYMVP